MRTGQFQGMGNCGAAQAAAAGWRESVQGRRFPRHPARESRQAAGSRRHPAGLAPAQLPAIRYEPARGTMARQYIIQRADSLQLGHVQTRIVGRLEKSAELGLIERG